MKTLKHANKNDFIVPHKLYQLAIQVTSKIAFDFPAKHNRRSCIEKILATLQEYLFLNMGRVLVPNHNSALLYIRYAHGIDIEKRFISYSIDQGITGLIFSARQAIFADDLATNNMYLGKLCSGTDLPYSNPAISGVPIIDSNNNLLGVLCVNHGDRANEELSEVVQVLEHTATLIATLLNSKNDRKLGSNSVLSLDQS